MIVNTPLYSNSEVRHWLRNRELGKRPVLGTASRLRAQLYSSTQCVRFWNPSNTVDDTHHGGIFNFDFSPDGSLLVAACERKSILMFDPLNGKHIHTKNQAHSDCVNCVRFLDSRTFATCSDDTNVCLWDARFLKHRVRTFRGHSNWVKNIEYAQNKGLLVTSGFDGSIYAWEINSYSDSDVEYAPIFHTNGLMRSKLTPDASKLVIATTGGYLMVVHDLDLDTLCEDLNGFKPNMYRLMQMSGTALRQAYSFNHLFTRKRNRVELISDFHREDEAEMITSLEIHPQGWCVVSRNTSKEDRSEWTCVHDIQGDSARDENETETICASSSSSTNAANDYPGSQEELASSCAESSGAGTCNDDAASESSGSDDAGDLEDFDLSSTLQSALERVRSQFPDIDLRLNLHNPVVDLERSSQESAHSRNNGASRTRRMQFRFGLSLSGRSLTRSESDTGNSSGDTSIVAPSTSGHPSTTGVSSTAGTVSTARDSTTHLGASTLAGDSHSYVIRSGSQLSERTMFLVPANKDPHDADIRIHRNKPRLTHFVPEANVGRGFIKEVCFSNDGRLICSPFGYGIRLFAFDPLCNELCDCLPSEPTRLFEVTSNMSHSIEVVTTKFSPTHPLIVSGCLNGKVDFHQPVL